MKPTKQQEDIVKQSQSMSTKKMKVNAIAGSGKTSSLVLVAQANIKPSLYIAFNKAIADEASEKFPSHVECRTTHSLAFAQFGHKLMHKLKRPKGGYVNVAGTSKEIARYYNIDDIEMKQSGQITASAVGFMVKNTVRIFEQSGDETINRNHVSRYRLEKLKDAHPDMNVDQFITLVIQYAKKLWKDRIDIHSQVMATHDTYLKLWQLSEPTLDYDIIYLDEAQDTGDPVLDIVNKQKDTQIVIVGDTYQSIYEWRGAVNAMEKASCPTMQLTQSFRYGQAIADMASLIIDNEIEIKGNEKITSEVLGMEEEHTLGFPYTKLYRTNTALLMDAVTLISQGIEVSCEVDTRDFKKLLDSSIALRNGNMNNVKHEELTPYGSWKELIDASKDEQELTRIIKMVESGQAYTMLSYLPRMTRKSSADVTLSTAHKSKGREWDQVVLANDFPPLSQDGTLPPQERNLLYVAATRAMKKLVMNSTCENIITLRG